MNYKPVNLNMCATFLIQSKVHMKIIKKHFWELTPKERGDLARVSIKFGDGAGMKGFLKDQKEKPHIYMGYVFMLYGAKNKLIAWSAIIEPSWSGKRQIWVYVRKQYRRAGYGTTMYRIAKRKVKRFHVKPWNDTGYAFFRANKKEFSVD